MSTKSIITGPAFGAPGRVDPTDPLQKFEYRDNDKSPSWKSYGTGYAMLRVQTHLARPYLSITAVEGSNDSPRVRGIRREVMMTLDVEDGRKLFEWLRTIYEPTSDTTTGEATHSRPARAA